jgi:hypothetical protein
MAKPLPPTTIERVSSTDPHDLLLELVRAVSPLTVSGTPVRLLDTRLNRAMEASEKYFNRKGVHISRLPQPKPQPKKG